MAGKQMAKGEKEILADNSATLKLYKNMISVTLLVYAVIKWIQGFSWFHVVLSLSAGVGLSLSYGSLSSAAKPSYGPGGNLISGGTDLNMEGGISDYFKDIIMVTCACLLLSLISDYFWYLWLVIPAFALYKLWSSVIKPWIFAPAPEVPQQAGGNEPPRKGMRQTKQRKQASGVGSGQPMSAFNLR